MNDNKNNEILRLDIRLKGKDKEKFLQNINELKLKKYPDYIRKMIHKDFIYVNLYRDLLNEFRKQGNNLNQIAKHLNVENEFNNEIYHRLENIEYLYREILNEVKKL